MDSQQSKGGAATPLRGGDASNFLSRTSHLRLYEAAMQNPLGSDRGAERAHARLLSPSWLPAHGRFLNAFCNNILSSVGGT